ncbi:MAG TPA: nucleoside-diphosphate sugar epimerase/dehydratase [Candidatus Polarisedimenticolaceae bacterium]|nr:nucleoside-diphosphate sugar epimerase/dehydratase [Candidatus Polarisedimenticolaceae bacterium]
MNTRQRLASLRAVLPKMAVDGLLFASAYVLAFKLRVDEMTPAHFESIALTVAPLVLMKVAVYHLTGSYRSIWRYSSLTDLEDLVRSTCICGVGVVALAFMLPQSLNIPRSVPFIDMALALLFTGGVRMLVRVLHESSSARGNGRRSIPMRLLSGRSAGSARRALIVGAGDAGEMMVREMMRSARMDYAPVAFVDDDPIKHGSLIHGVPVLGGRAEIPRLVQQLGIKDILIAIPSARGKTVREIVQVCKNTPAGLKILPDLTRLQDGKVHVSDLRQVQVEDLLGREPAELDLNLISSYLRGKRILVTGAGGSIGSELCRQILRFAPAEIHLMGRGENSIYEIYNELSRTAGFTRLVQVIGDVINKKKLEGVFAMYRPQIVFHAGADKHVPLMEMNPDEAVFNNIVGTKNVLEVSNAYRVERVVCISTDKAVNPTSVMGCCKRVAELLVRSNLYANTVACAVRFGNVLGSRGSVIPHFQRQIELGGPITVTHRDIKRYFMTIPEAAGLVIQAGAMGSGGEIFVLDMGEPVKIWDLAVNMVRLAGLEPGRDVEVRDVGLRPGEKLDEELSFHHEIRERTSHVKIMCVRGEGVEPVKLLAEVKHLTDRALRMDFAGIRTGLKLLVPEFQQDVDTYEPPVAVGGER